MKEITQEQKEQLLNLNDSRVNEILGVKELEVGKWYKKYDMWLFNLQNENDKCYGFSNGIWDTNWCITEPTDWKEATQEEVENALITEAKRRGLYNIGDINIKHTDNNITLKGYFGTVSNLYEYHSFKNTLELDGVIIFEKGKWSEVIEEPKKDKQQIINQINELLKQL